MTFLPSKKSLGTSPETSLFVLIINGLFQCHILRRHGNSSEMKLWILYQVQHWCSQVLAEAEENLDWLMNVDMTKIFIVLIMTSSFGRLPDFRNHRMPLEMIVCGSDWYERCTAVDSVVFTWGPFHDWRTNCLKSCQCLRQIFYVIFSCSTQQKQISLFNYYPPSPTVTRR